MDTGHKNNMNLGYGKWDTLHSTYMHMHTSLSCIYVSTNAYAISRKIDVWAITYKDRDSTSIHTEIATVGAQIMSLLNVNPNISSSTIRRT